MVRRERTLSKFSVLVHVILVLMVDSWRMSSYTMSKITDNIKEVGLRQKSSNKAVHFRQIPFSNLTHGDLLIRRLLTESSTTKSTNLLNNTLDLQPVVSKTVKNKQVAVNVIWDSQLKETTTSNISSHKTLPILPGSKVSESLKKNICEKGTGKSMVIGKNLILLDIETPSKLMLMLPSFGTGNNFGSVKIKADESNGGTMIPMLLLDLSKAGESNYISSWPIIQKADQVQIKFESKKIASDGSKSDNSTGEIATRGKVGTQEWVTKSVSRELVKINSSSSTTAQRAFQTEGVPSMATSNHEFLHDPIDRMSAEEPWPMLDKCLTLSNPNSLPQSLTLSTLKKKPHSRVKYKSEKLHRNYVVSETPTVGVSCNLVNVVPATVEEAKINSNRKVFGLGCRELCSCLSNRPIFRQDQGLLALESSSVSERAKSQSYTYTMNSLLPSLTNLTPSTTKDVDQMLFSLTPLPSTLPSHSSRGSITEELSLPWEPRPKDLWSKMVNFHDGQPVSHETHANGTYTSSIVPHLLR